jgi:hypothetical protein
MRLKLDTHASQKGITAKPEIGGEEIVRLSRVGADEPAIELNGSSFSCRRNQQKLKQTSAANG